MKTFLLDPQNDSAPMPGFLTLGAARAGWKVSRAPALGASMDGMAWLARLRSELEEADIIVGLGNFLALIERQIRGLFDSCGIHLTRTKVASTVRDYEAHSSSMCCAFYKDYETPTSIHACSTTLITLLEDQVVSSSMTQTCSPRWKPAACICSQAGQLLIVRV